MLKSTAKVLHIGLTKLFNKPVSSGRFTRAWKLVPIPKGNDGSSVTNYRPISLLSIDNVSKLLEIETHVLADCITPGSSLLSNQSIIIYQWGLQPKKSTTAVVLDIYSTWAMAVDKGKEECAIFFDLKKAFNSVPHRNLIDKLESTGLNQYILRWIVFYLSDRSQ